MWRWLLLRGKLSARGRVAEVGIRVKELSIRLEAIIATVPRVHRRRRSTRPDESLRMSIYEVPSEV